VHSRVALLLVLLFSGSQWVQARQRPVHRGKVSDQSGAVIQIKVSITDMTVHNKNVVTNGNGSLPSRFSAHRKLQGHDFVAGFKTYVQSGITLDAGVPRISLWNYLGRCQ